MTTDEFLAKQKAKIDLIINQNIPLEKAVKSIMSVQSKRIFIEAKNVDGGSIGEYKKKGVYISPKANQGLPAFPLNGKPNAEGKTTDKKKTVFDINTKTKRRVNVKENGHDRKTGYFESFLAYKRVIGRNRNVQTIDLFLTGSLQRNWANAQNLSAASAKRLDQNNYQIALSEYNMKKISKKGSDGLKYGNVFGISKSERQDFLKVIQFEFKKALS